MSWESFVVIGPYVGAIIICVSSLFAVRSYHRVLVIQDKLDKAKRTEYPKLSEIAYIEYKKGIRALVFWLNGIGLLIVPILLDDSMQEATLVLVFIVLMSIQTGATFVSHLNKGILI